MILMLASLAGLSGAELLLYSRPFWRRRQVTAALVAVLLGFVSGSLFIVQTDGWSYLGLLVALYRCFNLLRVACGISQPQFLRSNAFRSSAVLIVAQFACLGAWSVSHHLHMAGYRNWLLLAGCQLVVALILAVSTWRQLQKQTPPTQTAALASRDLPSITVCVPARNETEALERCLRSLIASDYPKLEILVLDDCSQDRTPEIIRSFAHDGVRFIKGKEPPANWLPKNWAYKRLNEEANGELLLFCGVDLHFEPASLRLLVTYLLVKEKQMLSIMPINMPLVTHRWQSLLVQPIRYAWEVSLPRRLFKRPPVLSSCWLISKQLLRAAGGFSAVSRSVSPESHFAELALTRRQYSFMHSSPELGLVSTKAFSDQLDTAIRTRYPQLHRRPELVLVMTVVELLGIVATLPLCLASLYFGKLLAAVLSGAAFILLSVVFARVCRLTYRRVLPLSYLMLLPAVLMDIGLRHDSMWQYEFSIVHWKGRNMSWPVMQVVKRLPHLN